MVRRTYVRGLQKSGAALSVQGDLSKTRFAAVTLLFWVSVRRFLLDNESTPQLWPFELYLVSES